MLWWFISAWIASGAVVPISWLLSVARRGVVFGDTEAEQKPAVAESHSAATAASTSQYGYGIRWLASVVATWAFKLLEPLPGSTPLTPKANHPGRYMLSGLVGIGALILLYVGSFSAPNQPASSTVAHAPAAQLVVPDLRPIQPLASADLSPSPAHVATTTAQSATDGKEGEAPRDSPHEPASLGGAEQAAAIQPRPGDGGESTGNDADRRTEATAPQVPAASALLMVYPKVLSAERGSGHRRARGPSVPPYVTPASRGTWLFPPTTIAGGNS